MKYFQLLWKNSNFVSSRKQPRVSSDYNLQSPVDIQISNHVFKQKKHCKTNEEMRNIHACSDISRHNQTYSGIFKNYSDIFQTLCNSGIFRIMVYSKPMAYSGPWYIQNSSTFRITDIFRAGGILRTLSSICDRARWETANGHNYFCNIGFSCRLVYEINMIFFNVGLIFTQEVIIQCKKVWGQGWRGQRP